MGSKSNSENKTNFSKYKRIFWLFVASPFLLLALGLTIAAFSNLPTIQDLENPESKLATQVLSSDGKVLGKYFRENRTVAHYDDLSPYLVEALVSTEDERYYQHSGVDFRGLVRAVSFMGSKGGASTISQQLAKLYFSRTAKSKAERVMQKLQEWIIATRLERRYTKEEIIAMYFNKFDFVNNAVGIESAAQVYFNTTPSELNIQQSAMLVGMAQNPSLFNPRRRPDTTAHRRMIVFAQMKKNGKITQSQYDSLKVLPLGLDYQVVDHKEGIAPYFREHLRSELKHILNSKDSVTGKLKIKKENGDVYDIYADGLKVYTTIDSRMQKYAEEGVHKHLVNLQQDFFKDLKRRSKRNQSKVPFDWRVDEEEIDKILRIAMKRSDRYKIAMGHKCPKCGRPKSYITSVTENGKKYHYCNEDKLEAKWPVISEEEVIKTFDKPVKMHVYSHTGPIDTILSPLDSIKYYKSFLQTGLMSMDPNTGFVKAWVGGINFEKFQYDHVKQGKRQVGSTFKPLIYGLAIYSGNSPCEQIPNNITCFDMPSGQKEYCPKNSDGKYGGMMSLKRGLATSTNTVTAWVMKQYSPQAVVTFAKKLGITSKLDPVPSLCLGVADLSVYEMVNANSTFVNKGVRNKPVIITRIENKDGFPIYEFTPESEEAIDEQSAYIIVEMMKGVVDFGTGARLRSTYGKRKEYGNIKVPMAGKTGTTQNNSDGWFIGLTPDLVTGVWVGADDRSVRFSRTIDGQGANMALPIYGYYMNGVYKDSTIHISTSDFPKPRNPMKVLLDCGEYQEEQDESGEEIIFSGGWGD